MEEPNNPYAAPHAEITAPVESVRLMPRASAGLRLVNFLIDYAAQYGIGYVIGYGTYYLGGEEGYAVLMAIPDLLFSVISTLLYYVAFEGLSGSTLGKLVTGTKVVDEQGNKAGFGRALGRSFCRFIPFEAFSFLGSETRGWHDSIPKTYVVKCR